MIQVFFATNLGIGFAKTADQSFTLLRDLARIVDGDGECVGFPMLVGPSRKSFLKIGDDAMDESRLWGTSSACTACVAGGASVLRVHDVKEMKVVAAVADKCFRQIE